MKMINVQKMYQFVLLFNILHVLTHFCIMYQLSEYIYIKQYISWETIYQIMYQLTHYVSANKLCIFTNKVIQMNGSCLRWVRETHRRFSNPPCGGYGWEISDHDICLVSCYKFVLDDISFVNYNKILQKVTN